MLPGSLIPSDKYFLKNLTFEVRNPLVWLRHHSSQTLKMSPWLRKEFDWNGDVATRVDCVPQRSNSLRNIYQKGWVILTRSFVLEDECFLPEGGWWRLIARNSAVSLYGRITNTLTKLQNLYLWYYKLTNSFSAILHNAYYCKQWRSEKF